MNKTRIATLGATFIATMAVTQVTQAHDIYSPIAVYIEANYTKPSNNELSVGDFLFATSPGLNFDGGHSHTFIEPKNEYDFAAGLTYRFANSNTRLFLDYDHFDTDEEKADIDLRNICYLPPPDTFGFARLEVHAYEFRVGAMHALNFNRFNLDLLAFFENVKLTQTLFGSIVQEEEYSVFSSENNTRGFGPGIGVNARHYPCWMWRHWNLFAGLRASLLQSQYHFTSFYEADDAKGGIYSYDAEGTESIVGKLDVEFGINYHTAFKHEMHGIKSDISLGFRFMNMFGALKNGNMAFNPNGGANATVMQDFTPNQGPANDWGRFGPFLRFKIGGATS